MHLTITTDLPPCLILTSQPFNLYRIDVRKAGMSFASFGDKISKLSFWFFGGGKKSNFGR
jgi:hypothetical protein